MVIVLVIVVVVVAKSACSPVSAGSGECLTAQRGSTAVVHAVYF